MSDNNRIVSRTYYKLAIRLTSPVNIGNGVKELTDSDVLRNSAGECFIPGTSLAGVFRNYMLDAGKVENNDSKKMDCVFGYSNGEKGRMSSIYVSDLFFESDTIHTSVRDRINLGSTDADDEEDKTSGQKNKFDMEVVEPGAKGNIEIEVIVREQDRIAYRKPNAVVAEILFGIQNGHIRLGAVKNRGYGRITIDSISTSHFEQDDRGEWVEFLASNKSSYENTVKFAEWEKEREHKNADRFSTYRIPLKITGGISIRKYSAEPGKADFEHITAHAAKSSSDEIVPVIPGTSWNGAIRADAREILAALGLGLRQIRELTDEWFGKAKNNDKSDTGSSQSRIAISESVIRSAVPLKMTRNNINRFTAGTKDGALYTEISYFGGHTELEYMISDKCEYREALAGLMILISNDIARGLVAIGGQTAVGRGILEADQGTLSQIDTKRHENELRALYRLVQEKVGK